MEYEQAFQQETRDLVQLASNNKLTQPSFRDDVIGKVLDAIRRKKSVLLVGMPGVGKTAIVHGLAHALLTHPLKRGLRELTTSTILRNTKYIGEWQTKAGAIVSGAKKERTVLYIVDIWNITTVGVSSNDNSNLFDFLLADLQAKKLQLLAEASPDVVDELRKHPQLLAQFEEIQVDPLSAEQIRELARQVFATSDLPVEDSACQRLLDLCERFLPATQGPGQVINFTQHVLDYCKQKNAIGEFEPVTPAFVEKVFTIYTGLPGFVISRDQTKTVRDLRCWFRERVIGQDAAIEAVVEMITLFKAGLQDPNRPLGSFLFVGPTGVGKTELAKALASFLFGSESRLLRFDMSEFKDYHAFQMLLGDPGRPSQPSRLLDPVRSHPFQVILFDEIEKAHPNIWDILLQLLDEGQVSPAKGPKVSFRNSIVIVTSNVGARDAQRKPMGFAQGDGAGGTVSIESLEAEFRPELLNRFQHIVPFQPLQKEQVKAIARKELGLILTRDGVTSRNLIIDVQDDVLEHTVDTGYDQRYGARALKRQLQKQVILPIATYLMEHPVEPGSVIKVALSHGRPQIRLIETPQSLAHKKQRQPVTSATGQRYQLADLRKAARELAARILQLAEQVGEGALLERLNTLDQDRTRPDFWADSRRAHQVILETDEIGSTLDRLASLRSMAESLDANLAHDVSRDAITRQAHSYERLCVTVAAAELELLSLGPAGKWDALLEIRPLAQTSPLLNLLLDAYRGWALDRGYDCKLLAEPLDEGEPILLWIRGAYAFGYLAGEHGLHRYRDGDNHSVVRVSVVPVSEAGGGETFLNHRALKQTGLLGGRVRSRIELADCRGLVLQNANSLTENQDIARLLGPSWRARAAASDDVIRRYDAEPFLVRDFLTEATVGKKELFKPGPFHELLVKRVLAIRPAG